MSKNNQDSIDPQLLPIIHVCGVYGWNYKGRNLAYDYNNKVFELEDEELSTQDAIEFLTEVPLVISQNNSFVTVLSLLS